MSDLETIHCLLCQAIFTFSSEDDQLYKMHLKMEHRVYFYMSWIVNKTLEEEAALRDQGVKIANEINDYQLSIANKSPINNSKHEDLGEDDESGFSDNFFNYSLENIKVINKASNAIENTSSDFEMQEQFECIECNDFYSTETLDTHFILVPVCSSRKQSQLNKEIERKIVETSDFYEETFDESEGVSEYAKDDEANYEENSLQYGYENNLGETFDYNKSLDDDTSFDDLEYNDLKMKDGKYYYQDADYIVQSVNRKLFENYEFEEPML